jgi:hypothetical protein
MYSILFHLLWLSLLEIIFYFEYIGPLETKTYQNTIKRLIKDKNEEESNYLINPYNTSNIIDLNDMEYNINDAKKDREQYNYELYMKSINYWLILMGGIMFFYLIVFFYKYRQYLLRKKEMDINLSEIEFTTVRNRTLTADTDELSELSDVGDLKDNKSFIDYNNIKKVFINKCFFYIFLGILILGFEYLFFNYIIIKYKVLSDDEIIFQIYKLIDPLLENIFHD